MESNGCLRLEVGRNTYGMEDAMENSISVGEFIEYLKEHSNGDMNMPIIFSNDGGYTYGYVTRTCMSAEYLDEE